MVHRILWPPSGKEDSFGPDKRLKESAEGKLRLARLKLDDDHDRVLDAIVKGSQLDQALQAYRKSMIATDEMLGHYLKGDYEAVRGRAKGWI
jgi:hypothetical protein